MFRKTLIAASAMLGVFASTMSAFAGPKGHDMRQNSSFVVIQGTITNVDHNALTVTTPVWYPYGGDSGPMASTTYKVNVSHAVEETYAGNVVKPQVTKGEVIVVVGRLESNNDKHDNGSLTSPPVINALVVEESAGGNDAASTAQPGWS